MNERIKELWERACTRYSVYETLKPQDERKNIPDIFAELIVVECSGIVQNYMSRWPEDHDLTKQIKQRFGVEQ
jgi:hypothetical protein